MKLQLSNRLLPSVILSVANWLYSLIDTITILPVLSCMLKETLPGSGSNLIQNKVLGTVGMTSDVLLIRIGNPDILNKVLAKSVWKCGTFPQQKEVLMLVRGKTGNVVRKGRFYARRMRTLVCLKAKVSTTRTIALKTGYHMKVAASSWWPRLLVSTLRKPTARVLVKVTG